MSNTFVEIDGKQHPVTIKGATASIPTIVTRKLAAHITTEILKLYPDVKKVKFKEAAEVIKPKAKESKTVPEKAKPDSTQKEK